MIDSLVGIFDVYCRSADLSKQAITSDVMWFFKRRFAFFFLHLLFIFLLIFLAPSFGHNFAKMALCLTSSAKFALPDASLSLSLSFFLSLFQMEYKQNVFVF